MQVSTKQELPKVSRSRPREESIPARDFALRAGITASLLRRPEIALFFLYLIFAALWVLFSDRAIRDFQGGRHLQTVKALVFVSVTAWFSFIILRRSLRKRDVDLGVAHEACERFELVARASNDAMWDW